MSGARRDLAIVLAAGAGRRLGEDKALVELGGRTAVERIVGVCADAGLARVRVVRQRGSAALPERLAAEVSEVESSEMIASLRAGLGDDEVDSLLVWPVDHPLVGRRVVRALLARAAAGDGRVVLPLCAGRPGHPILLPRSAIDEIRDPAVATLRDVVHRDAERVVVVEVDDGWVLRDIDDPADLRAARGFLAMRDSSTTELMRAHRSRRAYLPDPIGDAQLRWIIDSARFASTSGYMQAYSAVVVRDPDRRDRIAELCADQRQIREAPVFVAVCADLHKIRRSCERHRRTLSAESLEVFVEATVDAALFGQNLQLAAESEGLGSCMIGAARDHPVELAAVLELPPSAYVVFGMTVGWPADDPVPRGRMPLGAVLHDEHYDQDGIDDHLEAADDAMRAWARACNLRRTGVRPIDEQRGWSDRMAYAFGTGNAPKGRDRLREELRELGFGLERDVPPAEDG